VQWLSYNFAIFLHSARSATHSVCI